MSMDDVQGMSIGHDLVRFSAFHQNVEYFFLFFST